jgi:hypothetical protein
MKRFRFAPDALLALRHRKLERLEAELAGLRGRREAALRRAADLERQSLEAREAIQIAVRLRGADLRLADASSASLLQLAREARAGARGLEPEIANAGQAVLRARRGVEALEALRERNLLEWRRAGDREEEALAAELYMARHRR